MGRSAVILAGGLATRMGGREKALIELKGSTFLEKIMKVLELVTDETIISFRDEEQYRAFKEHTSGKKKVLDTIHNAGPLAGMLEGLKAASGEYVFVVACDMPHIDHIIVDKLFDMAKGHDAVIPVNSSGQKEPLHAVYRKGPMVLAITYALQEGKRSVMSPVMELSDVIYPGPEQLNSPDGALSTFININTPEDLKNLENL